jgi:hypothetical protein
MAGGPHVKIFANASPLLGTDAFAFDTLAVDQASSDASDSYLPMESILPADSSDFGRPIDKVIIAESLCPILSDSIESSDWILI